MNIGIIGQNNAQGQTTKLVKQSGITLPRMINVLNKDTVSFGSYEMELEKDPDYCEQKAFKIYSNSRDFELSDSKRKEEVIRAKNLMEKAIRIREQKGQGNSPKMSKSLMYMVLFGDDDRNKTARFLTHIVQLNKELPFEPDTDFEKKLLEKMDKTRGMRWEDGISLFQAHKPGRSTIIRNFILNNADTDEKKQTAINVFLENKEFKEEGRGLILDLIPSIHGKDYEKFANVLTNTDILKDILYKSEPPWKNYHNSIS